MPRSKPPPGSGEDKIRSSLAAAEEHRPDKPADDRGGGGGGGGARPPHPKLRAAALPANCPVQCLGLSGQTYYFMDSVGQFAELRRSEFGADGVGHLFALPAAQTWALNAFTRLSQNGIPLGLDKERLKMALMGKCAEIGIFDADNRVRQVGAWLDSKGRLVWHLGDRLLVIDARKPFVVNPGLYDGYVYPRGPQQPAPADCTAAEAARSAAEILGTLERWIWKRGKIDARIHLGWLGCALIGGALSWRPAEWINGDMGTGKSTLQTAVTIPVLGGEQAIVQASDASGAGIWQRLEHRSLPVILDEQEPKGDNRQIQNVIALARQAASGGRILRGGADHGGKEFTARTSFQFSSILQPPLEPQDVTRLAMVDLLDLPKREDGALDLPPMPPLAEMMQHGTNLRRMLTLRWQQWPSILAAWRAGIEAERLSARMADTWGTLLAMADLLLNGHERETGIPPAEEIATWCKALAPEIHSILTGSGRDHERMLQHLTTWAAEPWTKGQKLPIEVLVARAAGLQIESDIEATDLSEIKAQTALATIGIKVVRIRIDGEVQPYVCLADRHQGLMRLFSGTKWGAGVWAQSAARVPGSLRSRQRFGATRFHCAAVPLFEVIDPGLGDGEANPPRRQMQADLREPDVEPLGA